MMALSHNDEALVLVVAVVDGSCGEMVGAVVGSCGERTSAVVDAVAVMFGPAVPLGAVVGSCGEGASAVVDAVAVMFGPAAAAEVFAGALPLSRDLRLRIEQRKKSRFLRFPCCVIVSGIRSFGEAIFLG